VISLSQLTQEALSLPPEERARLAQTLFESIQDSPDRYLIELAEEAIRRDYDLESGKDPGISHEQVILDLRKKFG